MLGSRLIDKIKEMNPEILVTDCLSCRLQFHQLLPHKVLHPVEILWEAYGGGAKLHGSRLRVINSIPAGQPQDHRLCPAG